MAVEGDSADGVVGVRSRTEVRVPCFPGLRIQISTPRTRTCSREPRTWGTRNVGGVCPVLVLEKRIGADRGFGALVVFEAGESDVGEASLMARLGEGEAVDFARENELAVGDEGHAVGGGKALRTFTNKVDMGRLFQDEAGSFDGIAQALDAGNAAGFHAASVHKESVKLDTAVGGEKAAETGVKGGVIFKDSDGGLDSIDRRAASGQDGIASFESDADA